MPKKVKINWQQQVFTISDQKFSLQAYYLSPIKQIWQFLQQYEKYQLKSALLSINLRNSQFEQLYKQARDQMQQNYEGMLEKTMQIIHDLLITTQFVRVFNLKYHVSIIETFRSAILRKDCDPYGFNPRQFSQEVRKVKNYLKQYQNITNQEQLFAVRKQIIQYTNKIKQVQKRMIKQMEKCRVVQPYLAQNCMHQVVDTGPLFKDYRRLIKYQQQRFSQACQRKSFKLRQAVLQQGNTFIQQIIKTHRTCLGLARQYNANIYHYGNYLRQTSQQVQEQRVKRKHEKNVMRTSYYVENFKKLIDTEFLNDRQIDRSAPAALMNRIVSVKFKGTVRISDICTNQEQIVQMVDNPQKQKRDNEFQYKDPYEDLNKKNYHIQRQRSKKNRYEEEDQFVNHFNSRKKKKQSYNHLRMRQLVNNVRIAQFNKGLNWFQVSEYQNTFAYWFKKLDDTLQMSKTRYKSNQQDDQRTAYKFQKKEKQTKKSEYYNLKGENKSYQKQRQIQFNEKQARNSANQLYEQRQLQQYKRRMIKLKNLVNSKTYESFANINRLQSYLFKTQSEFQRYGIRLSRKLKQNSFADLNKFFFFYFKERYYRQHEKLQQANQNPIKFNDHAIDKLLTHANINRLSSFTKDNFIDQNKMFIIWGHDIIKFQLKKSFSQKWDYFQFICYTSPLNAQKILYELRKTSERKFQESIITRYYQCQQNQTQVRPMKKLFSFIENIHRILYDRHKETINLEESVKKGQQIADQIFKQILDETPKQ